MINTENISKMPNADQHESAEIIARASFVKKFHSKYGEANVSLYAQNLTNAIDEVRELESMTSHRNIVILYFHSDFDPFSKEFCEQLTSKEWTEVLIKDYYLVAWDITEDNLSKALKPTVKKIFGYSIIYEKLIKQASSIFVISSSTGILETIDNTTSLKHFPYNLKHRLNNLNLLEQRSQQERTDDADGCEEICSRRFQQIMYEYIGDRDYDSFEYDEHDYLKKKIFFAIYGLPDKLEEDEEKNKTIDSVYSIIRLTNNKYSKWDDKIVISFIYNCTEIDRHATCMNPLPIFVIRKCKSESNPCRLFLDLDLRVYTSWKRYLHRNKLPRCRMIVPSDGRYKGDPAGNVLLDTLKSPRSSRKERILHYVDIVATVLALISAFAMVASLLYGYLALPAGIVGLICALYSITRSSMQIHDRRIHKQDMNIKNSDARGAYLNIIGNTIGIVGGALTRTVAIIATKGIKIGKAVVTTVNAFNYAGLSTDFVGILNAIHAMKGSRRPDALQILQFAFSILFFNNSIVNLVQTKGQFIQSEISQSIKPRVTQRPNHKNTGQRVTHLRNIHTDDIMKTLANVTTQAGMSRMINFSSQNGRVTLNNVSVTIMKQTVVKFQGMYLPPTQYVTKVIQSKFLTDEENVELYVDILYMYPDRIKGIIIDLGKKLIKLIKEEHLQFSDEIKKMFPHSTYVCKILEVINMYFEDKQSESKPAETEEENRENFFRLIESCYNFNSSIIMDLMQYYLNWFTTAIYEYERAEINREKRRLAQEKLKVKITCKRCGGHYYRHSKNRKRIIMYKR